MSDARRFGPKPPPRDAPSAPPRRPLRGYTLVDFLTQGYVALVGLLVLAFHGRSVEGWPLLLAAHALCLLLVHLLIRLSASSPGARALDFLRGFYPVLLYTAFFRETGLLNHMFVGGFLDPAFMRLDSALFGFQPSILFMNALPYPPVSELLYAAYFSYYPTIFGIGLALFLRDRRQFLHYVSVVSFVFYACYLVYIFVPVVGPRLFSYRGQDFGIPAGVAPMAPVAFPDAITGGVFFRAMAAIYRAVEVSGASFPSSHVAVAVTTAFFSFRYLRPIRWFHFALVVLLCLSTVYCRYHYAVDVLGGLAAAGLLVPLGNGLFRRLDGRRAIPPNLAE